MDNILEIDLILNRQKYPKIYKLSFMIKIIILVFIYIIFTYKYQTYYLIQGRIVNNELELLVPVSEMKYIQDNNRLMIEGKEYRYQLVAIDHDLYINSEYKNCQYIYLKIDNIVNIDNYIYEIKIPKEYKVLAKYLKDYL